MQEQPSAEGRQGPGSAPGSLDTPSVNGENQPFGSALEPVLRSYCEDRLSPIRWFRTDWQRGGALTGYATWINDDERQVEVVVKLPVPPIERLWLHRLQSFTDVVPHLYAHGDTLNGYDMAWLVLERMPHGPLGASWGGSEFNLLVQAAGRFYAAAAEFPVNGHNPRTKDWRAIFERAREVVHLHDVAFEQRWNRALKRVHRRLNDWIKRWEDRPRHHWCHGDLHPGNAMTRKAAPDGPAVLLDFARAHVGHWVEDAVYLEHLFWARRQRLGDRRLCSMIAKERKRAGLSVEADWPQWASVERALLAMSTPAMLEHDGDPHHVQAALEVLEIEVQN